MYSLSNFISLLRFPLAFLFLYQNTLIRLSSIILAVITDGLDGYLARKNKTISKLGTILDPLMDKFFVYFVLSVLYLENQIYLWQILAVISRDLALCIYGFYMLFRGKWRQINFHAIKWGKVTTIMQFILLTLSIFSIHFSNYLYAIFIFVGLLALKELFSTTKAFS
jgi:phosphatidylglycerophosphate synthase